LLLFSLAGEQLLPLKAVRWLLIPNSLSLAAYREYNSIGTQEGQRMRQEDNYAESRMTRMRYRSYEEVREKLAQAQQKHPDIATVETIGKSYLQRPIEVIRISSSDKDVPRVLFVGGIHGLEKVGVEMVIRLMDRLLEGHGTDQRITTMLEQRQVWLVPVLNPDGYATSRRKNARGVDLNRNFAVGFSSPGSASRWRLWPFYAGPSPYSEPETRAIKDLTARVPFSIALSFHSFGGLINFPYGHTRTPAKDNKLFRAISQEMRKRQPHEKYAARQLSWLYKPKGSLEDDLYEHGGTLAFLIEMMRWFPRLMRPTVFWRRFSWFNPSETELASHLENNVEPALYLVEIAADPWAVLGSGGIS
jgi:carboxypeptidase T